MSRKLFEEAQRILKEAPVKLDPVGQEDKDVDNDGDSDKTDSYLKKRRGVISAAIASSKKAKPAVMTKEETERYTLDEKAKNQILAFLGKPMQEEVVSESDLPMTRGKKEKTITVRHESSGKEKVIVDTPAARKQNAELGFRPVKEETEEVEGVAEGAMSDLDADRKDRQYQSRQAKTTMKHIPNPTAGEKKAAKDIKPGVAGYRDRIDMLKSAEARGGLKKEEAEQVNEDSTKLWKDHGDAFSLLDYHTNKSGDSRKILAYKQKLAGIEKKVKEKFGNSVLSAMKKHTIAMADSWYGHSNKQGEREAAEIRKKHKINWNGELNEEAEQVDEMQVANKYALQGPQKAEIPAYKRKAQGAAPLKLADLKRKDTMSDLENLRKMEEVDTDPVSEIIEHVDAFTIELPEKISYQDYLKVAMFAEGIDSLSELDESEQADFMQFVQNAYDNDEIEIVISELTYSEMQDKIYMHQKQGSKITGVERKTLNGKPYAAYVVTDKTGMRRRYIYHGNVRRVENLGQSTAAPGASKPNQTDPNEE